MQHGSHFFRAAVDACLRLKRRGLLLSQFVDHIPKPLPEEIIHCHYLPLSGILPHCAAIIHHGGIGTSAKAMAAGIPQLIMPMAYDQPDNALRLQGLGISDWLPPKRFNGEAVAKKLERLLHSEQVKVQCQKLAAQIDLPEAIRLSCDVIETTGRSSIDQ